MSSFAEFFAGIGLVREAVEPLGWHCVFANDIAPDKAEMYRAVLAAITCGSLTSGKLPSTTFRRTSG